MGLVDASVLEQAPLIVGAPKDTLQGRPCDFGPAFVVGKMSEIYQWAVNMTVNVGASSTSTHQRGFHVTMQAVEKQTFQKQ